MLFLQQIARVNICNIYSLVNLKNYFWVLFFSTLNCSYWLNTSFIVAPRKQNSMCKSGCIRQELQSFHHVTSPTKWEIGRDHTVRVMSVATMAPHIEQLSPFPFSKLSIISALQDCLYDSMTLPPPHPFLQPSKMHICTGACSEDDFPPNSMKSLRAVIARYSG